MHTTKMGCRIASMRHIKISMTHLRALLCNVPFTVGVLLSDFRLFVSWSEPGSQDELILLNLPPAAGELATQPPSNQTNLLSERVSWLDIEIAHKQY